MFSLARVSLSAPISLLLPAHRSRVGLPTPGTVPRTVAGFDACFRFNPTTRTIHAELPPLPRPLLIYGPDDFADAAADTPDQHAERVLAILAPDPAATLQALIDGLPLPPPPPRVPRELPNWRLKAVLFQRGLLPLVNAAVADLPGPAGEVVRLAWHGDAMMNRHSPTLAILAASLEMDAAALDALFLQAAALNI